MNIHNKGSLIDFYVKYPDCKDTLEKWYHDVSKKIWRKPNDVIKDYNKVRTIRNDRAIFKINENDYRIIVELNYQKGCIFIKFTGTHASYDKVDAATIDLYKKRKVKP
ncbi:MAG TPA: type II toxin-antitoxin system HigB family toxin [Hanamia sp.]